MKTKQVNQYQCDHCGKKGLSASHMRKHERRCTLNPERECGMCAMVDEIPAPMEKLLALLPDPNAKKFQEPEDYPTRLEESEGFEEWCNGLDAAISAAMPALRETTGNCPACIMAALRQRGLAVKGVDGFNFTAECKAWWDEFNEARRWQSDDERWRYLGV